MKNETFGFVRHIELRKNKKKIFLRILKQILASLSQLREFVKSQSSLFLPFTKFLFSYFRKKILSYSLSFEKQKNVLVRFFMMKRGRYNRPFLHVAALGVVVFGILVAPFLSTSFSQDKNALSFATIEAQKQSITVDGDVFKTEISQKPRDKIITYRVQKGDTVSTIAQKFGISADTIRWANDLSNDELTVDDELKILPVTGVAHKVSKGDTVYTIAKKYDTDPQGIVDFPFNDFANPQTFSLVEGQILIVPEGVKPSETGVPVRRQVYIAQGPVSISQSGFTWPLHGIISQFAAWYHMAIDITSPIGTPIVAAQNGTVVQASTGTWDGGYGNSVIIEDGAGFRSHYAHLQGVNVNVGDAVAAGRSVIGWVGMSGRTTGPHLHFEIMRNGVLVNPLNYLQ